MRIFCCDIYIQHCNKEELQVVASSPLWGKYPLTCCNYQIVIDEEIPCALRVTQINFLPLVVYFKVRNIIATRKSNSFSGLPRPKTSMSLDYRNSYSFPKYHSPDLLELVLVVWLHINQPYDSCLVQSRTSCTAFELHYLSTSWINQKMTGSYVKQIKFQIHRAFARLFCHGKKIIIYWAWLKTNSYVTLLAKSYAVQRIISSSCFMREIGTFLCCVI